MPLGERLDTGLRNYTAGIVPEYIANDDGRKRPFGTPPVAANCFYHKQIKKSTGKGGEHHAQTERRGNFRCIIERSIQSCSIEKIIDLRPRMMNDIGRGEISIFPVAMLLYDKVTRTWEQAVAPLFFKIKRKLVELEH